MGLILGQNGFLIWWAWGMPRYLLAQGQKFLAMIGDIFAIKLMAQHLNEPIFQDPTWQGRLIGIFIRIIRLLAGLLVQGVAGLGVVAAIIIWYVLPFYCLFKVMQ